MRCVCVVCVRVVSALTSDGLGGTVVFVFVYVLSVLSVLSVFSVRS